MQGLENGLIGDKLKSVGRSAKRVCERQSFSNAVQGLSYRRGKTRVNGENDGEQMLDDCGAAQARTDGPGRISTRLGDKKSHGSASGTTIGLLHSSRLQKRARKVIASERAKFKTSKTADIEGCAMQNHYQNKHTGRSSTGNQKRSI